MKQLYIHCFGWSYDGNEYAEGDANNVWQMAQAIGEATSENQVYASYDDAREALEGYTDEYGEIRLGGNPRDNRYTRTIILTFALDAPMTRKVEDWSYMGPALLQDRASENQHESYESEARFIGGL